MWWVNNMPKIIVINSGSDCPYNNDNEECTHLMQDRIYCMCEIPEGCPLQDYPDNKPISEYHWT